MVDSIQWSNPSDNLLNIYRNHLLYFREPAQQLANMAEWNDMGGPDHSQSIISVARQTLLKDSMDAYLKVELRRQQREAFEMHKACSAGIDKMFDKMEQV